MGTEGALRPAILITPFSLCFAPARGRGPQAASERDNPKKLLAQTCNSGFEPARDTYNGMGTGSDGKICYVLSSEKCDVGAGRIANAGRSRTRGCGRNRGIHAVGRVMHRRAGPLCTVALNRDTGVRFGYTEIEPQRFATNDSDHRGGKP